MMNYKELADATHQWADARGIVKNGKVFTQTMKLISEFGELCDAIIKSRPHEIKDAIGDMMVVLSNIASIKESNWREYFLDQSKKPLAAKLMYNEQDVRNYIGLINQCITSLLENNFVYGLKLPQYLKAIAQLNSLTLTECWESAYNEIKDRKGYLNEHGNFVKEGDV